MSELTQDPTNHLDRLLTVCKSKSFLGREFLTWLWFQSEKVEIPFKTNTPAGKEASFDLWVDDRVVLESSGSKAHTHTLKGGDPSQSIEAAAALKSGKTVSEIKIGISVEGYGDYTCVLNYQDLSPRSIQLPEVTEEEDLLQNVSPVAVRLELTRCLLNALDCLFVHFLEQRVGEKWEAGKVEDIRSWIREKDAEDFSKLH